MRPDAVDERHARILGKGPRIGLLTEAEMPEECVAVRAHLREMARSRDPDWDGDDTDSTILPLMMHHPSLFRRQADLGVQLLVDGALSPRDREIAILRVAWLCGAPYEWGEHVHFAKSVGLDSMEIERITQGPDAPGWSPHERAILLAVAELRADAMISDATWAVLAETLDARQLIELPVVIGQYQAVAYYQNALRLPLTPGNAGLNER
ncbi:MAG: carboxymuconolactone decarboxylase family protein [Sphingobium sp.]